jgi:hypothetical protein
MQHRFRRTEEAQESFTDGFAQRQDGEPLTRGAEARELNALRSLEAAVLILVPRPDDLMRMRTNGCRWKLYAPSGPYTSTSPAFVANM